MYDVHNISIYIHYYGSSESRKYLHLHLQGAPLLEEGLHHLLSDWEVRRELGAALDHIGVDPVEELESVEVIIHPVLNGVFWETHELLESWNRLCQFCVNLR